MIYDNNVEFIRSFVGSYLKFSAANFEDSTTTLDEASKRMLDLLIDHAALPERARVLDVGSGWGCLLRRMKERGLDVAYRGLGPSIQQNDFVTETIDGDAKIETRPLEQIEFETGEFDTIFLIASFCHVTDKAAQFAKLVKALKPGGRIVMEETFFASQDVADKIAANAFSQEVQKKLMGWSGLITLREMKNIAEENGMIVLSSQDFTESYRATIGKWIYSMARTRAVGETETLRQELLAYTRVAQMGWKENAVYNVLVFQKPFHS